MDLLLAQRAVSHRYYQMITTNDPARLSNLVTLPQLHQ